jgi:hypothetical protein
MKKTINFYFSEKICSTHQNNLFNFHSKCTNDCNEKNINNVLKSSNIDVNKWYW